jgi:hypothetical protein
MSKSTITRQEFKLAIEEGISNAGDLPADAKDRLRQVGETAKETLIGEFGFEEDCGCPLVQSKITDHKADIRLDGVTKRHVSTFYSGFDSHFSGSRHSHVDVVDSEEVDTLS